MAKNQRRKKSKTLKLIPFNYAIYALRVLPEHFHAWKDQGRFEVRINKSGKECITEAALKKLAYSDDVHNAAGDAFTEALKINTAINEQNELSGRNALFLCENLKRIEKYRGYIKTLENIHASYNNRVDVLRGESALVAAYVLYSQVINLLNMACFCLENCFWYSGIFLRMIDEPVHLAHYFIVTEKTEQRDKHLKEWFRLNKAPSHGFCRKAISKHVGYVLGKKLIDVLEETMTELYGQKSKWIHPNYNGIMEVYRIKTGNKGIISQGFDYGRCSYTGKILELTDFFQSSIWTAVQGFYICFYEKMPLKEQHRETLHALDKKFRQEVDKL